jgi:hypothetical protein
MLIECFKNLERGELMGNITVLWDIDGTLSVNGRGKHWNGINLTNTVTRTEVPELFEGIPERFQTFALQVNEDLLRSITDLEKNHDVTNGWLTAWEECAVSVFSPKFNFTVGENWKALTAAEGEFTLDPTDESVWWKTKALRRFLEDNPDERVIWVDDLIDTDTKVERDNRKLIEDFENRVAMVGVYSFKGVTPDVSRFVKKLATEQWQAGMFIFE